MATGQKILCGDARQWCSIIALIHMIQNLLLVILSAFLLDFVSSIIQYRHILDAAGMPGDFLDAAGMTATPFMFLGIICGIFLLMVIIGLGVDFLLLKGAQQRNVRYLKIWLIFTFIKFVMTLLLLLDALIVLKNSSRMPPCYIPSAIFDGMALVIVYLAKMEIDGSVTV